jgi:hypothetical protein
MSERSNTRRDFGDIEKHEARLKLWLPALRDFKNSLGRQLKYFTLPGEKAYDVIRWKREGLIKFDGRGFPDVCYCDSIPDNFLSAKRILGNTVGIMDRFENVIKGKNEDKYKPFWEKFPYDVYNLDFCGTCFEPNQPLLNETFSSIIRLINDHVSKRNSNKFLLFLTIRIDEKRTHKNVISDLKSNLETNREYPDFTNLIDKITGGDIPSFIQQRFCDFILTGLPKAFASKIRPQRQKMSGKIENLYRACYLRSIKKGNYYIGKFVFFIGKEEYNLKITPPWYRNTVIKSLKLENIIRINESQIQNDTKQDLIELENEIKRIEGY